MSEAGSSTATAKRPAEDIAGLYASDNVTIAIPAGGTDGRPAAVKHMSSPAYQSPIRHHRRGPSTNKREVKETLNARSEYSNSEDDGTAQHRLNQYTIKQEIGRGSFGAVHLATDQFGQEYAVKEFSKSRLRKRAQSNLLRRPDRLRRAPAGSQFPAEDNALDLIKEEIAIMKKLNHPNVVSLVEVLDDPDEDSLYMVLEMCKKGVVMKVGLEAGRADPYDEQTCRCYFRDMILGVEYLHAQGIIHRDIKPDNCLVTADNVLKIVDFGVSEMFEKDTAMNTAKSAGSPAFMPPELCVAKHGQVSGRMADIWSMGVTLYCLRLGRIPFEKKSIIDLFESIRSDSLEVPAEVDEPFRDLVSRLLEKDPSKRITMDEVREHPWVTKGGTDPLLSKEENTSDLIEPPTKEELDAAITGNMGRLLVVMKAVKRFKRALFKRRPELMESIFGGASRIVQPPLSMRHHSSLARSRSDDTDSRRPVEGALTSEGIHRDIEIGENLDRLPQTVDEVAIAVKPKAEPEPGPGPGPDPPKAYEQQRLGVKTLSPPAEKGNKGQAHDPLEDTLFLFIGTGSDDFDEAKTPNPNEMPVVSESPGAIEMNVYEQAYQEEIERIMSERNRQRAPTLYLTRRVDDISSIREAVRACVEEHLREHKDRFDEQRERIEIRRDRALEIYRTEGKRGVASYGKQGLSRLAARAKDEARRQVEEASRKREERKKGKERGEKEEEEGQEEGEVVARIKNSNEDLVIVRKKGVEGAGAGAGAGESAGEHITVQQAKGEA